MNTLLLTIVLTAIVSNLASCSKAADPLAAFEPISAACSTSLASPRSAKVYENPAERKWNKLVYGPNQVKYDVRKSESLVSPYLAEIHAAFSDVVLQRDTRDEAEAAQVASSTAAVLSRSQNYRFAFAYQDNKWKLQKIEATTQITSFPDLPVSTTEISIEQLLKQFPEAASCAAATRAA